MIRRRIFLFSMRASRFALCMPYIVPRSVRIVCCLCVTPALAAVQYEVTNIVHSRIGAALSTATMTWWRLAQVSDHRRYTIKSQQAGGFFGSPLQYSKYSTTRFGYPKLLKFGTALSILHCVIRKAQRCVVNLHDNYCRMHISYCISSACLVRPESHTYLYPKYPRSCEANSYATHNC